MRIGVYLGRWSLDQLGGMGVYLQNLLRGVESVDQHEHELVLLVDQGNQAAARALALRGDIVPLARPDWSDLSKSEQAAVIRVRRLSYRCLDAADAQREDRWSAAAKAYLWGLDDAANRHAVDLLYFTLPPYLKQPRLPVLLTIHDLKHIHRPQDHDRADLARRRRWTRVGRSAALVYASYEHVRHDIERHFQIPVDRTAVLPLACPSELSGADHGLAYRRTAPNTAKRLGAARAEARGSGHLGANGSSATNEPPTSTVVNKHSSIDFDLPDRFVLMPAQLWPHKNHERVVRAIAHLRDSKDLPVTVLCTGQTGGQCAHWAERITRLAKRLGVGDQVRLIGYVDRPTLRALYTRARMILVASLYEPGSFPAMEALALGKPLAASRITSIPETVGEAALLFDPNNVHELARAMQQLWTDDALCSRLSVLGPQQIGSRSWRDVGHDWLELCERALAQSMTAVEDVS